MQLVFRVEMPTDRVEWVAVRPRLERFAAPYLDNFQVRFHIRSLRAGAVFDDPPLSPYRLNCSALPLIRDRSDRYPGPPPRFQYATDTFLMCSTRPRNRGATLSAKRRPTRTALRTAGHDCAEGLR
ncbi:hypothetical protein BJA5080_04993 [Bradyrhizobium diazoefficiens SEMIA 5080]|uniref:Uncharacterized protein n=1 Tax=Bradyrhizobium diazoefficiens SEMIA 5080 TaxID=754504 RepID=A0A837CJQ0_9BRAD|nr:hypothetical protein BJA5080_04993 [Bradyrhizobium diazoefficiens SEMIA 5080]